MLPSKYIKFNQKKMNLLFLLHLVLFPSFDMSKWSVYLTWGPLRSYVREISDACDNIQTTNLQLSFSNSKDWRNDEVIVLNQNNQLQSTLYEQYILSLPPRKACFYQIILCLLKENRIDTDFSINGTYY